MECSVIVSLVEFVDSDAETTPKNPAFEIRFGLFYDQVVAETKALGPYAEGEVKVRLEIYLVVELQKDELVGFNLTKHLIGEMTVKLVWKMVLELELTSHFSGLVCIVNLQLAQMRVGIIDHI